MRDAWRRRVTSESLERFRRADQGQDLVEYGLLAALVSIFAAGAVTLLGQLLDQVFWQTIAATF